MLKKVKHAVYSAAGRLGVQPVLLSSGWRRQRLLILGYHGVSLEDEHIWDGGLFMSPQALRKRFELLRSAGCAVLPLDEGVRRLYDGTLPGKAVCITFDDGLYDFYARAWPLLREYGYPATLYFTTYYSEFRCPVFDPMCSYLLWKARGQLARIGTPGGEAVLLDEAGRDAAAARILQHAREQKLSGQQKAALLESLAADLGVDYGALCAKRILQLMSGAEAAEIAGGGLVDIQLHTHRHRVSRTRELFIQEIEDNRQRVEAITRKPARHFCYPSGCYLPEFPGWLSECGVESAVTCDPGLAAADTTRWLLPRLIDTMGLSASEFSAWLSGLPALLPRRAPEVSLHPLLHEEAPAR